jgi:hypothetical protein
MTITPRPNRTAAAFTLLEVMIAIFLFFTTAFAILTLTTQTLKGAKLLKQHGPSVGKLVGDIMLTNKVEFGTVDGDFRDDGFRDYTWQMDINPYPLGTNMVQVDIFVFRNGNLDESMSFLKYDPNSGQQASTLGTKKFQ